MSGKLGVTEEALTGIMHPNRFLGMAVQNSDFMCHNSWFV